MKAINVILARERLDRERKKKEDTKKARVDFDGHDIPTSTYVALAPSGGTPIVPALNTSILAPNHIGEACRRMAYQVENLSRGSPISTSMGTPRDITDGRKPLPGCYVADNAT